LGENLGALGTCDSLNHPISRSFTTPMPRSGNLRPDTEAILFIRAEKKT